MTDKTLPATQGERLQRLYHDNGDGTFSEVVYTGAGGGGGDASAANQTALNTLTGAVTEAAPATDTASSGLNGRLQRIAQRLTSLIAQLPASLGIKTAANSLSVAPASDAVFVVDSELPAARALATSSAMPSAPDVNVLGHSYSGANVIPWRNAADGDFGGAPFPPAIALYRYDPNAFTWRRQESSYAKSLIASAAFTTSQNSPDQTNPNNSAVHVRINVTANASAAGVTPKIQGKDSISGNYYDILVGAPITATGLVVLKAGLGIASVANLAAGDLLPFTWRVAMVAGDASSVTYSVSGSIGGGG